MQTDLSREGGSRLERDGTRAITTLTVTAPGVSAPSMRGPMTKRTVTVILKSIEWRLARNAALVIPPEHPDFSSRGR